MIDRETPKGHLVVVEFDGEIIATLNDNPIGCEIAPNPNGGADFPYTIGSADGVRCAITAEEHEALRPESA